MDILINLYMKEEIDLFLIDFLYTKLIFVNKQCYFLLSSGRICVHICKFVYLEDKLDASFSSWYELLTYIRYRHKFDSRRCSYHHIYSSACKQVKNGDIVEGTIDNEYSKGMQFVRSSNKFIIYQGIKIDFFSADRVSKFPVITTYPISYWSDALWKERPGSEATSDAFPQYEVYVNLLLWKNQILANVRKQDSSLTSYFVHKYVTYYLLIYQTSVIDINNIFELPYRYYCHRNGFQHWEYTLHVKRNESQR